MKHFFTFLLILIGLKNFGDNCKPDLDQKDKINNTRNVAWQTEIYETPFGASMINTSELNLKVQFGRYGDQNILSLFFTKDEASAQNATFESQYKGEKGNEYVFGFSSGDPIKFNADQVNNNTKLNNITGKLVTTIIISTILSEKTIIDLKQKLDQSNLSAIRVNFAGAQRFEKDIKDRKSENFKNKFLCFFDFNSKNPIVIVNENSSSSKVVKLPINKETNKITYTEVVSVDSVSKDILYNRAKIWMVNYFKNENFSIQNLEEGKLVKTASFPVTYDIGKGFTSTEQNTFNLSVSVKDGKYKYELTDFVADNGIQKSPCENGFKLMENNKQLYQKTVDSFYKEVESLITKLKENMKQDMKLKEDW
jgi:acyl-CoA synthetase (AMP-forming)/AMP-acid ligase II